MRILVSVLCLEKAGSHILALSLASAMVARGHQVFLFNQGEQLVDKGMVRQYLEARIPIIGMDSYPLLNTICWKLNGLLSRIGITNSFHESCKTLLLRYIVRQLHIDVVHSHEVLVEKSRLVKIARRVPIVVTDHGGYSMLIKMSDWSFRPFANLGRAIVAVSEYSRKLLEQDPATVTAENNLAQDTGARIIATDFQAEAESLFNRVTAPPVVPLKVPVHTIYNGVQAHQGNLLTSTTVRSRLNVPIDALVFGMIGRGTAQKGWNYALDAYLQLKQKLPGQTMVFVCMGAGPMLDKLQEELGEAHPDILFVGNVDDPHAWMPACDVGIMPSCFSEGLPLSIIEFYEHQIPVIASTLGGIPELVTPSQQAPGGLLITMNPNATPDVANLLEHMLLYATNGELRIQHGLAAKQIHTTFGIAACAAKYELLFEEVLAQKPSFD